MQIKSLSYFCNEYDINALYFVISYKKKRIGTLKRSVSENTSYGLRSRRHYCFVSKIVLEIHRSTVADLRRARGTCPPSPGSNSFNFMLFFGKFGKIVCWRPLEDWRPSGKSWIRYWRFHPVINGRIHWKIHTYLFLIPMIY